MTRTCPAESFAHEGCPGTERARAHHALGRAGVLAVWAHAGALGGWILFTRGAGLDSVLAHGLRFSVLAIPGLLAWRASSRREGPARLGWRLVAAAWLVSAVAGAAWFASVVIDARGVPWLERAAEVLYDGYYPLIIAGFALLASLPESPAGRLRLAVEALIAVGASQALAWYFMTRHLGPGGVALHWDAVLANQVGDAAVLFAAVFMLQGARGVPELAPRLLSLSAFAAMLADVASAGARVASDPALAMGSEAYLVLSSAFLSTAALAGFRRAPVGGLWTVPVLATAHLPHLALLAVAGLVAWELPALFDRGGPAPVLTAFLLVLTGLAVVRMAAALHDAEQEAAARSAREERLAQGQKLEALGQLSASVAHDFANVLTALGSCARALNERLPDSDEAEEIDELVQRGTTLCRGLLGFARRSPPTTGADLREVVEHVAPLLRRVLPRGVSLVTEGRLGDTHATADPSQLEVALVNLVVNARDAMPGGGTIRVSVDSTPHAPPGKGGKAIARWARIVVADEGAGMSPETLARCQEPFFTTKPPGLGTGLGLATVRGIAEHGGGGLEIESAPGRGTRVALLLPFSIST